MFKITSESHYILSVDALSASSCNRLNTREKSLKSAVGIRLCGPQRKKILLESNSSLSVIIQIDSCISCKFSFLFFQLHVLQQHFWTCFNLRVQIFLLNRGLMFISGHLLNGLSYPQTVSITFQYFCFELALRNMFLP